MQDDPEKAFLRTLQDVGLIGQGWSLGRPFFVGKRLQDTLRSRATAAADLDRKGFAENASKNTQRSRETAPANFEPPKE